MVAVMTISCETFSDENKICLNSKDVHAISEVKKKYDICQYDLADTSTALTKCLDNRCIDDWYKEPSVALPIIAVLLYGAFRLGQVNGR